MRKITARLMTVVVGSGTLVSVGSAIAPAAYAGCAPEYDYAISSASHNYKDLVPYSSAPGGHTLSIVLTAGASVSATFTGEIQTEESAIIASAKQTLGVSVSLSLSASVSYGDSWTVPSTWSSGQLHAGADRESFAWKYEELQPTCKFYVIRSGTSNAPYHLPAFWSVRG